MNIIRYIIEMRHSLFWTHDEKLFFSALRAVEVISAFLTGILLTNLYFAYSCSDMTSSTWIVIATMLSFVILGTSVAVIGYIEDR